MKLWIFSMVSGVSSFVLLIGVEVLLLGGVVGGAATGHLERTFVVRCTREVVLEVVVVDRRRSNGRPRSRVGVVGVSLAGEATGSGILVPSGKTVVILWTM